MHTSHAFDTRLCVGAAVDAAVNATMGAAVDATVNATVGATVDAIVGAAVSAAVGVEQEVSKASITLQPPHLHTIKKFWLENLPGYSSNLLLGCRLRRKDSFTPYPGCGILIGQVSSIVVIR